MDLIPLVTIVVMCLLLIIGCWLTNRLMNGLMMNMSVSGVPWSPSMSPNISKLMCIYHMLLMLYLIFWIPKCSQLKGGQCFQLGKCFQFRNLTAYGLENWLKTLFHREKKVEILILEIRKDFRLPNDGIQHWFFNRNNLFYSWNSKLCLFIFLNTFLNI